MGKYFLYSLKSLWPSLAFIYHECILLLLNYRKLKIIFPGTTNKICQLLQLMVVYGGKES